MRRLAALALIAAAPMAAAQPAEAPSADGTADGTIVAWRYMVRAGDTFAAIARRMGVPMADLGAANGIPAPYLVRIGQVLKRPESGPEPGKAQVAPRSAPKPRPAPSPRPAPEPRHVAEAGAPRLVWPTSGAIVGRFGATVKGRANNGIDLAALEGMTVHAAAPGKVLFAGTEPERFGQLIVIDHGGGWVTAYAYLGQVRVKEGDAVKARQVIARIGKSGEVKKPTLHFELRHDNAPRDPYPYLPARL